MHAIFKEKLRLPIPNELTIEWFFFTCTIVFGFVVPVSGELYYLCFAYPFWFALLNLLKAKSLIKISRMHFSVVEKFFWLIILQIFGLFQISTMLSIRMILATCAMMIFLWFSLSVKCKIQLIYIRLFFKIVMLFVGYRLLVTGVGVVNTLPAVLLFYYCLYLVVEFLYGKVGFIQYFYGCIIAAVSLVAGSRTSFFVMLIIFIMFFLLNVGNYKKRTYLMFFPAITLFMFIGVFCYINVHGFSWYDSVDFFMQSVFNKKLDSSRGYLWSVSLGELDFVQIFVGAGTGRLPTMERYSTASFHSSYIQMIMQNGLAGLLLLYLIFWEFWKYLIVFLYKKGIRFVLACFIGIVIYNCFECTLLQNKAILGAVQWMILCTGVRWIKEFKNVCDCKMGQANEYFNNFSESTKRDCN